MRFAPVPGFVNECLIARDRRVFMECQSSGVKQHSPDWHVLHVVPNHEKKVAVHLLHRSVEHFLPLYSERSRWSDRSVTLERPLFPGYVFVRLTRELKLLVISSPGVLRILGRNGSEVVGGEEVERIRTAIAAGFVLRPHPPITVGTRVRVSNGVFAGTEGMVIELRSNCKVIISMSAVNQCYSLETDIGNLQILGTKAIHAESEPMLISGNKAVSGRQIAL
jgi:transcription antitermination factor NusG